MPNYNIWCVKLDQTQLKQIDTELEEIIQQIKSNQPIKQLWRLMKAKALR